MKVLNWRGMHGFGDFVPPFSYAFNEAVRLNDDVHIIFHFVTPRRKFKEQDEWTYEQIIEFIHGNMDLKDLKTKVTWEARYSVPYEYIPDPMHSNSLDAMYAIHNFRPANDEYKWRGTNDTEIALVSTINHLEKFNEIQYRNSPKGIKDWKDPWPYDWEKFAENFEKLGFKVRHIHYEMATDEIAKIIRDCGMVYSYHAGAAWLARWQCAPMVVCSTHKEFTESIFPWSVWRGIKDFNTMAYDIFDDQYESLQRRDKYLFNAELYKYAVPGTFVWQNLVSEYHMRWWPYLSHDQGPKAQSFYDREKREIKKLMEK